MTKDDNTIYYVQAGIGGKIMRLTGWTIRSALGGLGKVAKQGWTIVEDRSGK